MFTGPIVSLRSEVFPDRWIRHRFGLGYLEPAITDLDKRDATFQIIPSQADPQAVSLRAFWIPGDYSFLRHQFGRVKLNTELPKDLRLFNEDSSFWRVEPGLMGAPGSISFRSYNMPDAYLRHRNFELWVEKDNGTDLFKRDATFHAMGPLAAPEGYAVPNIISTWPDVQQAAQSAAQSIPVPSPEMQTKPMDTPASDALGVTQALITGKSPINAAVAALPGAFMQAAGGPVAKTPLGSLLGVGLGGAATGTGPLPGALGVAANQLFGQSSVPTPARFPTIRVILELHPSFRHALERTGTSMATNLWKLTPRVLGDFRGAFMDLAAMRHEDEFRAALLTLLRELVNHVSMGLGASVPPLSTGLTVPLPVTPWWANQNDPRFSGIRDMGSIQGTPGGLLAGLVPPAPAPPPAQALIRLMQNAALSGTSSQALQPMLTGPLPGQAIVAQPAPRITPMAVTAVGVKPMAVTPVGVTPMTVMPAGQTVGPLGMARAVSGLGSGRRMHWRA